MNDLVSAVLPLVGVALGAWLSTIAASSGARREFVLGLQRERQAFLEDVMLAMDNELVMLGRFHGAMVDPAVLKPTQELVRANDQAWRRVNAVKGLRAPHDVQIGMVEFDAARGRASTAHNNANHAAMTEAVEQVKAARIAVLNAINEHQAALAPIVARHVLPARTRVWRRLRRQPVEHL